MNKLNNSTVSKEKKSSKATSQIDLELVEKHAQLVKKVAYHMSHKLPPTIMLEDLIQAGMIGLLEAAGNYKDDKGASFETFATIRVKGAMIDEVRKGDWTPRSVYRNNRRIAEAKLKVENIKGGEVKDADVADYMGISLDAYYDILKDSSGTKLFAIEEVPAFEEITLNLNYDDCSSPLEGIAKEDLKEKLAKVISTLPQRERLVLALYYDEELNLREIGSVIGVSESRVSQILGKSIMRLQSRIQGLF